MKTRLIIGVTGHTRVGKTTYARNLKDDYNKKGMKCEVYSFASALRAEVNPSCKMTYGIDAYTKDPTEKEVIRHMLIEHAEARRAVDPQYWIKQLAYTLTDCKRWDVAIIDDVRYENEAHWIWYMGGEVHRLYRHGIAAHGKHEDQRIFQITQMVTAKKNKQIKLEVLK